MGAETSENDSKSQQQQQTRINPFLDSPEDEEADSVTVEQVNLDSEDIDYNQAIQYYKSSHQELYHRPGPVYTIPEGDERIEAKGDQKLKPQLLERRPLHSSTMPPLVSEEMLRKQHESYSSSTPFITSSKERPVSGRTSVAEDEGDNATPITPVRTAPPPPSGTSTEEDQLGTKATKTIGRFETNIHQADDLVPVHPHAHNAHLKINGDAPSCVSSSDAAFLAQAFGVTTPRTEASTLGSQLASADHAVRETTDEEDQTTPRLKRSPAMILPTDKQLSQTSKKSDETRKANEDSQRSASSVGRFVEEDNAAALSLLQQQSASSSSEMGRRKLPTLPGGRLASATTTSSISSAATTAPIYYSSSAPDQRDAATNGDLPLQHQLLRFDSSTSAASRLPSLPPASSYESLGRSSLYHSTTSTLGHPVDPAIIPGAQFRTSAPNTGTRPQRQILMSSGGGGRRTASAPTSPRFSDTMSQLLFKQELRQALSRRRHQQETTEIEANHREFVIRRMLNSGLLPLDYRREIDSVPDVVKCDLPYELIAGARVVPSHGVDRRHRHVSYGGAYQHSPTKRSTPFYSPSTEPQQFADRYQPSALFSPTKKSVACQSETRSESPPPTTNYRYASQTSSRYSSPQRYTTLPSSTRTAAAVDSSTQTMIASETQTDGEFVEMAAPLSTTPKRRTMHISQPTDASARQFSGDTQYGGVPTAAPDLLERTRRYFEEYDRRLRDASDAFARGTVDRRRYQFSDTESAQEMEWKREQVRQELERRKQKVASMIDLRSNLQQQQQQQQQSIYPSISSDYWASRAAPSQPQRYGSLPRRIDDYTYQQSAYQQRTPSQRATNYYGSLPRDFERYVTSEYDPLAEMYPPRTAPSLYSRSAQNLADRPNYIDPLAQQRQCRPLASYDDISYRAATTKPRDDTLLSQYANYVNEQINAAGFLDDDPLLYNQQQQPSSDYPSALPDYSTARLAADYAAEYTAGYSPQQPQDYLPNYAQSQPATPFMQNEDLSQQIPRLHPAYQSMTYDPRLTTAASGSGGDYVYSRRETNYGSRPTQPIGDYGNFQHPRYRRNPREAPYPLIDSIGYPPPSSEDYANQNLAYGRQAVGSSRPYWSTLPSSGLYGGGNSSYGTSNMGYGPISATTYPTTTLDPMSASYSAAAAPPPPSAYRRSYTPSNNNSGSGFEERWPSSGLYPRAQKSYSCSAQPRPQPQPYTTGQTSTVLDTSSLGRHDRRGILTNKPRKSNNNHVRSSGHSMSNINGATHRHSHHSNHTYSRSRNGTKIKRILLTRRYRHENVYHDLGFRVTGGKRLSNGDLGAFITAINRNKAHDTLGELKEGDQVLEWNGVLLRGKTFEEVERIINATSGEIEVVIKSSDSSKNHKNKTLSENIYDLTTDETKQLDHRSDNHFSPKDAPPVPAHRRSISQSYYDPEDINRKQKLRYQIHSDDSLGHLQVCLGYDQLNSILLVTVISARGLTCREYNGSIVLPNPFVKIYLLPGRKVANKRRTKYLSNTTNPEWHQTVDYLVDYSQLHAQFLEFTVWDYDKYNDNICLGQLILNLSNIQLLDNTPRWFDLQPADKNLTPRAGGGVTTDMPYTKPRTLNSNYFYNPANLDLGGYPAI